MSARSLNAVVEAILFASEEALTAERIAAALERQDATPRSVRDAIADLNDDYRRTERTFEIVEVAGGYKLLTLPEYNTYIRRVLRSRSREKLSQAALETLAVVAYRQPVSRADIENIRGVEAGPILRMLVDRGLVRIVGREESLGHPLLYGTTRLFLEMFGLKDLDSLPRVEELTKMQQEAAQGAEEGEGEGESDDSADADSTADEPPTAAVTEALAAMGDDASVAESADEAASTEDEVESAADLDEEIASDASLEQFLSDRAGRAAPAGQGDDAIADGDEVGSDDDEGIIRLSNHTPHPDAADSAPADEDDAPDSPADEDDAPDSPAGYPDASR